MATTYHLIVPMPAGRVGNTGKLSVFFVPRLGLDLPLRSEEWRKDWRNWPKVIRGITPASATPLRLRVSIKHPVKPDIVFNFDVNSSGWLSDAPSVAAWDAVFGTASSKSIDVKGFRPILRPDPLLAPTFDAPKLAQDLREIHQRLATQAVNGPPSVAGFVADPLFQGLDADDGELDRYNQHLGHLGVVGDVAAEPSPEDADFHQGIAYLQAHPELMRTLGLIVDLQVTLPPTFNGGLIDVESNYDANYAPHRAVSLEVSATEDFLPENGPGGWATIGDSTHTVASVDIGAAVAGVQSASTVRAASERVGLSPMRAAGLYLARNGQDLFDEISAAWAAQIELEDRIYDHLTPGGSVTQPIPADGSTLTAGRRYDVWDTSVNDGNGGWFSLWERTVPSGFGFPRNPTLSIDPPDDEGWMTYTASTEASQARASVLPDMPERPLRPLIDTTPLRVSPIVFSWRGWSLAVQPPGRAFSGLSGPTDVEPFTPGDSLLQVNVPYQVPLAVLPRLRYTRTYKFRARVVDYAGNSQNITDTNPGGITETPEITFGRMTQLEPPVVVRRVPPPVPSWGDTPTTLVVKSEFEQLDTSVLPTSRLLFPPSTDQFQCELHGLPEPDGLFTDQANYDMLVSRTSKSVGDHTVVDAMVGELVSADTSWKFEVDYLVEVPAAGIVLADLPGTTGLTLIPSTQTWPKADAVGIELRAGDRAPQVGSALGVNPSPGFNPQPGVIPLPVDGPALTAWVSKGVTRNVVVSSAINNAFVDHWSLYQQMNPDEQADLGAGINLGQHWMFSQTTTLTCIHAVRRPLAIPGFDEAPGSQRFLGRPEARLLGPMLFDVKSTGRMMVTATWQDVVDTPGAPGGIVEPVESRLLFSQGVPYREDTRGPLDQDPFQLPDTRRYDATISLDAISRYARYFTERATVQFSSPPNSTELLADDLSPEGIGASNIEVTVGTRRAVEGRDYTIDAVAGTIRRLSAGGLPINSDVYVDFIRLPINRRSDEAGGPGDAAVRFLNSGIPAVVSIEEVLPAFNRFRGSETPDDIVVSHSGQVVRVWLRRPWFTTGVGELLGVLVGGPGQVPVTEFARDPLSPTPIPANSSIGPFDFYNTKETALNVDGLGVDIAAYEVQFDETRELWFADVIIGASVGYRPLVKLSLVRYQPKSVLGASIGTPVVTEPIRLGSDRFTQMVLVGDDIEIEVSGLELDNEVIVKFQQRDPDISDPDLGWTDLGDPITLTSTVDPGAVDSRWTATVAKPVSDTAVRMVVEDAEMLTRQRPDGPAPVRATAYIETIDLLPSWTLATGSPPAAPGGVSATPQSQAVSVSWTAPANGGNPILRYIVERRIGTGSWGEPATITAPTTSARVRELVNGTQYGFRVSAETAAGRGPWSSEVTATPTASAPAQVGPVEAVGGHQAALVRWPAPADNGSPITGLRVERRQGIGAWGNGTDLVAGSTRYIARGLSNGSTYEFRVRASSALGDGPWSDSVPVTPDVMVPGQVRRVLALSGGGLVRLQWRVAAARGAAVSSYRIERRPKAGGTWANGFVVPGNRTDTTIAALAAGTEWEFQVSAENSVGAGAWSPPVAVTVDASGTVPAQVSGVTVAAADGALTVTWSEPTDGGSPLISFTVQRRVSGGAWGNEATVPGDQDVHRYAGLVNGTTYGVRVRAVNVVGAGDWSVEVTGSPVS